MAVNKRLLQGAAAAGGLVPSEHFGVVLYEGDGASSHSINGGKFGAAAYFNGVNSKIIYPTGYPFNQANSIIAVSAWVKLPTAATEFVLLGASSLSDQNDYITLIVGGNKAGRIFIRDASGSDELTANFGSTNNTNWNHYVWQLSATNGIELWVNGVNQTRTVTSQTGGMTTSSWFGDIAYASGVNYHTGINRVVTTAYYKAKVDQMRLFTKELSSSEVSTLYAETVETVESLDPLSEDTTDTLQVLGDSSCVATYRFENDETDLSGNYDATGTAIQYAAGRYGQAASFNGSSSRIQLPSGVSAATGNNDFTLSAWVYLDTMPSTFASVITTQDNYYFYIFIDSAGTVRTYNQNFLLTSATGVITTGRWYNIVATLDSTNGKNIYVNGTNVATSSDTSNANSFTSGHNAVGYYSSNGSTFEYFLDGKIDQVRIFNKAISASEVTTLYQENSLVASYRFEGNANDDTRNYDGSATVISYEYGLNFTPDFVWIKMRNNPSTYISRVIDSTRGVTKEIYTESTAAENTETTGVLSLDTGGFTVGSNAGYNIDGYNFVAWCLKANGGTTSSNTDGSITSTVQVNEDAGFSIVKYTGTGSLATVGHGLSAAPDLFIIKNLDDGTRAWLVYDKFNTATNNMTLNTTAASAASSAAYNDTEPTSTVFTVNTSTHVNAANDNHIAYCFHSVENFSSIGSYTGNGSTNGPIVETGFEPAFLMLKRTTNAGGWTMYDNKRNLTNPRNLMLEADSSNAETSYAGVDFLSNGFQIKATNAGVNSNGDTFIYMAFAADPDTEAPTLPKSFSTVAYAGNGSATTQSIDSLGFKPDLVWYKVRNYVYWHELVDSVRGAGKEIYSNSTSAETTGNRLTSFNSDGFSVTGSANDNGKNYVAWAWKADDNEPTIFGGPAKAVYKFEDNANDVTGNNNGTISGATYTTGKFNKAINFNGSGNYVTIPATDTTPLNFSSENFTISHWVYPHNTAEDAIYSSKWSTGAANQRSYYFGHNASGNIIISENPGGSFTSTSTVTQNAWNHVVYVRNASTAYIYINGSLDSTHSRTNTIDLAGTQNIYFGRVQGTPSGDMYDGLMDQTRFYSGALSQEQVTELYNETVDDNDDLNLGAPPASIVSANANAGFSIVKYEGDGLAGKQVPHGLSAAPEFIITKRLDSNVSGGNWYIYSSVLGTTKTLVLNGTNAQISTSNSYLSVGSTTYEIGTNGDMNTNGGDFIAYCFHSVAGYSKIGSYTGNGSSSGPTITTGFQPDWIMIKSTTLNAAWMIIDSVRGTSQLLQPQSSAVEENVGTPVNFTSNGFQITDTNPSRNQNGGTYIYMAIKIN